MKTALLLVVAALAVASVAARCPNGCSGHGNCGRDDKCACWANWQGNDCALRTCAYDNAWAMNKYDPHFYAECSNKGVCDRTSGECDCFDCFEGRACTRLSCPNDCSGHGKCRYINEQSGSATYYGWDAEKIQVCVCDGGFYGPDCSQRYCPMGDDPMTICDDVDTADDRIDFDIQRVTISFRHAYAVATNEHLDEAVVDQNTDEFVLKFTDPHGEVWTTQRIEDAFHWAARGSDNANTKKFHQTFATTDDTTRAYEQAQLYVDAADRVRDALKALPNKVIPDVNVQPVTVNVDHDTGAGAAIASQSDYNNTRAWDVSFTSPRNSGTQNTLQCFVTGCQSAGCQPMYKQLRYTSSLAVATDFSAALSSSTGVSLTADTLFDALPSTAVYPTVDTKFYDYRVFVEVFDNTSFTEHDGRMSEDEAAQGHAYRAYVVRAGDATLTNWEGDVFTGKGAATDAAEGGEDTLVGAAKLAAFTSVYQRYFADGAGGDKVLGENQATLKRIPVEYSHVEISNGVFVAFDDREPLPGVYMWLVSLASCTVDPSPPSIGSMHPNRENAECSNRGECDASSGVCACHEGYYGDNCQSQTILV